MVFSCFCRRAEHVYVSSFSKFLIITINVSLVTFKWIDFFITDKTVPTGLVKKSKEERWSLWTLRHGLSQITKAIVDVLNNDERFEVLLGANCEKIDFLGQTIKVKDKI